MVTVFGLICMVALFIGFFIWSSNKQEAKYQKCQSICGTADIVYRCSDDIVVCFPKDELRYRPIKQEIK